MIIIPLHILSTERCQKIESFFNISTNDITDKDYLELIQKYGIPPFLLNEEITGVCGKSVKNWVQGKNNPTKSKKDTFESRVKNYLLKIPGITNKNGIFKDEYTKYHSEEILKIINSNRFIYQRLANNNSHLEVNIFKEVLFESKLPQTIITNNLPNELTPNLLHTYLNCIRVEIALYLIASFEVEYWHLFQKHYNSIFKYYLPKDNSGSLQLPFKLWINRIVELYGFSSCDDFYRKTIIAEEGTESGNTEDNKLQTGKRWKKGTHKPKQDQISNIYKTIALKQLEKVENPQSQEDKSEWVGEFIEHGKTIVNIVICFQNLVKLIHQKETKKMFHLNNNKFFDLFQRYTFWHNYHKTQYEKTQN